jgi:hypothetical protein
MKKFIDAYKQYKTMKQWGYYRLCWIPINNGEGLWSVMELFDDELHRIDKKKVEIVKG